MKVEFELNLDEKGRPCIKFRHHDRDYSMEQRALGLFIKAAKKNGLVLINTNAYLGDDDSFENYEISAN